MATSSDKKSYELDTLERGWIKQALMNQSRMLARARQKEIVGGEVHTIRGKEIDFVNTLSGKF